MPLLRLRFPLLSALLLSAVLARASTAALPAYRNPALPLETRADDLLRRLTLDEKLAFTHGASTFSTAGIPRLGIPERWMDDGPHGVREDVLRDSFDPANRHDDYVMCMPVLIDLASTWDPDAATAYGNVIGEEARMRGKDIMLGPGVNIMRTPINGRNSEYFGEDPYLAGRMAVGYIRAVQSHGVASCVKHFVGNDQETQRGSIDVEMDERTLHEIYLPPFKAAVQKGGVWAVMGAYNRFRGQYCCENDALLNGILKKHWGFKGIVISDWHAVHDTDGAVRGGLDVEMGTKRGDYDGFFMAGAFKAGLLSGKYPMSLLDDKVRRSLRVMIATGALDSREPGSICTPEHRAAALRVAEEGIVLLKNSGAALPLDAAKLHTIAVIGENATRLQAYGGDSARIKALYEVSPLEGILHRVGTSLNVITSPGYSSTTGTSPAMIAQAVAAAKAADVAIVIGGLIRERPYDCEGMDRASLDLPWGQNDLIRAVVAANPHTIVVLVSGSPVAMDEAWLSRVPAVVEAWYGGSEAGNALAHVLFGDFNPSGKLPCTFPRKLSDSPAHALGAYPGKDGVEHYDEGLLVGYRWFDTKHIEPLFPFGFGLSYTTFAYSNLHVERLATDPDAVAKITIDVTNTGPRDGAEVAELYVHEEHPRLFRPEKELKGFQRVFLKRGETRTLTFLLPRQAFSYYDPVISGWVMDHGRFDILIGASSRDIRATATLDESTAAPRANPG